MLALSPPLFSNNIGFNWPLEEALGGQCFYRDLGQANSPAQSFSLNFPAPTPPDQRLRAEIHSSEPAPTASSGNLSVAVKKLNHNASERDRRKKINQLYSSLRNLLPASDHTKRLSIPATVSRVLKYIPELQKEVEGLIKKREGLLSKINEYSRKGNYHNLQVKQETIHKEIMNKNTFPTLSLSSVSTSQLNSREIAVQISSYKVDELSEMLRGFENDGLSVLNASSFESSGGRVFHNLHLQVEGLYGSVKSRTLGSKLNLCMI